MRNKAFSKILFIILILILNTNLYSQIPSITVKTDTLQGKVNDIVQTQVIIDSAGKVKGINIKLFYDPEIFECVNYKTGEISDYFTTYISKYDNTEGYFEYFGIFEGADETNIDNSEVIRAELKIKKQVSNNEDVYLRIDTTFAPLGNKDAEAIPAIFNNAKIVITPVVGITGNGSKIIPEMFVLYPNYPNPFNPETNLKFAIPKDTDVKLVIYNILGQQVKKIVDKKLPTGTHIFKWNGTNDSGIGVSSGMYIYRIQTKEFVTAKKLVLIR